MTGPDPSPTTIGYLGPAGTFTHEALLMLLPTAADDIVAMASVAKALDAVRDGEVAASLVPIENSVEGAVSATLDELAVGGGLQIRAEIAIPVRFCLAATDPESPIRTVVTHPHAQAQCRTWVADHLPGIEVVPAASTAAAAAAVARAEFDAAICAHRAAAEYGLSIRADDIADNPDAETRFILVGPPGPPPPATGADKTTLDVYLREDHPGALLEILTEFAVRGVNLTRIESRPTKTTLGNYYMSIDCEGHVSDEAVGEALMGLHRICGSVHYRGSYARHDGRPPLRRAGTSNNDFAEARSWLARIRNLRESGEEDVR